MKIYGVVVILRERDGNSVPAVFVRSTPSLQLARKRNGPSSWENWGLNSSPVLAIGGINPALTAQRTNPHPVPSGLLCI
jgi:hypothetical protein